ncbi:hypothetical protein [Natronomonas sp.]|uniref:hypothetical protein n=1 Tax=Natronomonas sp. TaxID=2184060 RepID=UPI00261D3094|nr:hypothetical protein [Natronomonas sp.]
MYGVVTRNEDETEWEEFDRAFYEVKDVSGRSSEPLSEAVSMISCFGDNAAGEENPDLVPVTPDGQPATRERTYFDWAYVCPTHEGYREGLLEMIADSAAVSSDVRLDDIGFPRPEYCYCERCNERFESWVRDRHESGDGPPPAETTVEDRYAWRAEVIGEFVEAAADRIPGRTYMTLYPDPYEGHLYERAGIELSSIEPHVDEFVVPLYDTHYGTTYWLEAIASGFEDRLQTPLSVELYAVDVGIDELIHAVEVAAEYGESVLFGYDAANARATLRRMDADAREGVEW